MGGVRDAVPEDPWQARLARMRRLLPLPLLAVSTLAALIVSATQHTLGRFELGLPAVAVAALLWTAVTLRLRGDASTRWGPAVFIAHSALAGYLVWASLPFAVFGYTGFLYSYGLGRRWRAPAFAVTSLIVSAGLVGGYPDGNPGRTASYLVVAVILVALVLNSASITAHAVEQNQERGRMIAELAEANRRLEASMAENAGLHAQLVTQARQAGITEERQRLAGEIHDTLAQGLTGIIAQLEAAEHTRHRPEESSRHLAQARTLARSNLTDARRSVRALRPEQLEDASLPEAVATLARTWTEQTAIGAALDTTGTVSRAGADTEAAVFRVAQEALSNVAKHARASRVQLTLTYTDDTLLLDVADDGTGFDPAARTEGYGLAGMRRRLDQVGGTLTIETAAGAGTTLNAAVPLAGPDQGGKP
jgi:signal transduction histidine kinase